MPVTLYLTILASVIALGGLTVVALNSALGHPVFILVLMASAILGFLRLRRP